MTSDTSDGTRGPYDHGDDELILDFDEPEVQEAPELNVRVMAPSVSAITNVIALVGPDLEPQRCHIYIRDGVIAAIAPAIDGTTPMAAAPPPRGDRIEPHMSVTIDGEGMIAIPGMVDANARMRSLDPGLLTLGPPPEHRFFLPAPIAPGQPPVPAARMGPEEYELAVLQGCVQRLKCGITTVVDHVYPFARPELDAACVSGYEASGIRWAYARGIMTRPRSPVCETFEVAANSIRALLDQTPVTPERLFVAPVGIAHVSPDDFARAAALADELGAGTYTCVAETPADRAAWLEETKAKPIVALDRAGFLSDRTVLARCVFLDGDEVGILAARGTSIVRCPSINPATAKPAAINPADQPGPASQPNPANQPDEPRPAASKKLNSPYVRKLLAAGVNVALGADMLADLFSAMRAELRPSSLGPGGAAVLSSRHVLGMATGRGAAAAFRGSAAPTDLIDFDAPPITLDDLTDQAVEALAPQPHRIRFGELSQGHAADIVLIPARSLLENDPPPLENDPPPNGPPPNDPPSNGPPPDIPLSQFLHAVVRNGRGPMVRHVLVEGQLVVADGVSTLVDEHQLNHEVGEAYYSLFDQLDLPAGPDGVWFLPLPPMG